MQYRMPRFLLLFHWISFSRSSLPLMSRLRISMICWFKRQVQSLWCCMFTLASAAVPSAPRPTLTAPSSSLFCCNISMSSLLTAFEGSAELPLWITSFRLLLASSVLTFSRMLASRQCASIFFAASCMLCISMPSSSSDFLAPAMSPRCSALWQVYSI